MHSQCDRCVSDTHQYWCSRRQRARSFAAPRCAARSHLRPCCRARPGSPSPTLGRETSLLTTVDLPEPGMPTSTSNRTPLTPQPLPQTPGPPLPIATALPLNPRRLPALFEERSTFRILSPLKPPLLSCTQVRVRNTPPPSLSDSALSRA